MSVINGLAARAHRPVVAVPDGWAEADEHPSVVAVGVEDAAEVAEAAFEEAQRRRCGLALVRAWFYSPAFDGDVVADEAERAQSAWLEQEMERDFAELADRYPGVRHHPVVLHGRPRDVLVGESARARLLVVGGRDPAIPVGSHLGPVTRSILNHAACPVMVMDPRSSR